MKDNTQRPSPSSPNLQAENHGEAGEGLDATACSASYSRVGKDESVQKEFIQLCKIIADDPEKLTEGINWWANIITMIHDGCDITRERMSFGKYD